MYSAHRSKWMLPSELSPVPQFHLFPQPYKPLVSASKTCCTSLTLCELSLGIFRTPLLLQNHHLRKHGRRASTSFGLKVCQPSSARSVLRACTHALSDVENPTPKASLPVDPTCGDSTHEVDVAPPFDHSAVDNGAISIDYFGSDGEALPELPQVYDGSDAIETETYGAGHSSPYPLPGHTFTADPALHSASCYTPQDSYVTDVNDQYSTSSVFHDHFRQLTSAHRSLVVYPECDG